MSPRHFEIKCSQLETFRCFEATRLVRYCSDAIVSLSYISSDLKYPVKWVQTSPLLKSIILLDCLRLEMMLKAETLFGRNRMEEKWQKKTGR